MIVGVVAAQFSVIDTYLVMSFVVAIAAGSTVAIVPWPVEPPVTKASSDRDSHRLEDDSLDPQPTTSESQAPHGQAQVVALISFMMLVLVGIEVAYGGLIGVYSSRMLGYSDSEAAYVVALYWFSFTMARVVCIFVAMVAPAPVVLVVDIVGCVAAAVVLVVFPYEPWAMYTSCIGFGGSLASSIPFCISLPPLLGYVLNASNTRYLMFGGSLGALVVPWIATIAVDRWGPVWLPVLAVAASLSVLGSFAFLWFRFMPSRPTKPSQQPTIVESDLLAADDDDTSTVNIEMQEVVDVGSAKDDHSAQESERVR